MTQALFGGQKVLEREMLPPFTGTKQTDTNGNYLLGKIYRRVDGSGMEVILNGEMVKDRSPENVYVSLSFFDDGSMDCQLEMYSGTSFTVLEYLTLIHGLKVKNWERSEFWNYATRAYEWMMLDQADADWSQLPPPILEFVRSRNA